MPPGRQSQHHRGAADQAWHLSGEEAAKVPCAPCRNNPKHNRTRLLEREHGGTHKDAYSCAPFAGRANGLALACTVHFTLSLIFHCVRYCPHLPRRCHQ